MTNQDESSDLSKSLLRRFIHENQEPRAPEDDLPTSPDEAEDPPEGIVSPIPGYTVPAHPDDETAQDDTPISPIRPKVHDDSQPQEPLTPSLPERAPRPPLTPREQMQRAEEALIRLREKMANVAAEFADGKLNRAQFDAIYARYSEQRVITERLLERDPQSQAWQSVVRPGHTQFLKDHYEARVLSYAIYAQDTFEPIIITGPVQIERTQAEAVLKRLKVVIEERGNPGPAHKKIPDGRCILFVPGSTTVAVAIFSLEPSASQIQRVQDIHRDFERANQHALRHHDYTAERMVFPHRALLEESR